MAPPFQTACTRNARVWQVVYRFANTGRFTGGGREGRGKGRARVHRSRGRRRALGEGTFSVLVADLPQRPALSRVLYGAVPAFLLRWMYLEYPKLAAIILQILPCLPPWSSTPKVTGGEFCVRDGGGGSGEDEKEMPQGSVRAQSTVRADSAADGDAGGHLPAEMDPDSHISESSHGGSEGDTSDNVAEKDAREKVGGMAGLATYDSEQAAAVGMVGGVKGAGEDEYAQMLAQMQQVRLFSCHPHVTVLDVMVVLLQSVSPHG